MTVSVEALDRPTCWKLIDDATIGRVALLRRRRPTILPVNFTADGERIVYRTAEGSALVPYQGAEDVAFEVDGVDDQRRLGWSVLVIGRATILRDGPEIERLVGDLDTWAPGSRDVVVLVRVHEITGRQVVRTTDERIVDG